MWWPPLSLSKDNQERIKLLEDFANNKTVSPRIYLKLAEGYQDLINDDRLMRKNGFHESNVNQTIIDLLRTSRKIYYKDNITEDECIVDIEERLLEIFLEVKQYQQIINIEGQLHKKSLENPYILHYLGCAYSSIKDKDKTKKKDDYIKAEKYFNMCLQKRPFNIEATVELVFLLSKQERYEEAEKLLLDCMNHYFDFNHDEVIVKNIQDDLSFDETLESYYILKDFLEDIIEAKHESRREKNMKLASKDKR